ncbi:fungal hydrophobin [Trichoderma aggressivum f. europaeum]|uniref:Fungal hydrophobin n=1 Tax=Trichoderma aggressivum f. europaeum TaxID=173218 RepID=A0AAE1J7J8_9HYPO|nr:fungal hydrophobin [Trichoderma aggressivum f. europaeum]
MKALAITALFIAGALAVPAGSYPPPPPPDYGGDNGGYSPGYPTGGGYVPPTPTPPPPPPPPPSYDDGDSDEPPTDGDGGSYEPPTDGDGDSSDGGDDGDDSDGGSDGSDGERSGTNLCPALISGIAQCCSANVLGLVNLDCVSPNKVPHSIDDFKEICADMGKQATCCTLGLLGLGVLCGK